jgi:hypothetical protein
MRAYLYLNSVDLNNGSTTFLMPGIKLPRRDIVFDEVRSYTGAIRQIDLRQPLVHAIIPLMVRGADMASMESTLSNIFSACLAGGTLTWQEATDVGTRGTQAIYQVAKSPEPEVEHDSLYRHNNLARFTLDLWVCL